MKSKNNRIINRIIAILKRLKELFKKGINRFSVKSINYSHRIKEIFLKLMPYLLPKIIT